MKTNIIKCDLLSKGLCFRFEKNESEIIDLIITMLDELMIDYIQRKSEIIVTKYNSYAEMWDLLFKISCEYDILIQ